LIQHTQQSAPHSARTRTAEEGEFKDSGIKIPINPHLPIFTFQVPELNARPGEVLKNDTDFVIKTKKKGFTED
jgi:hypothetical protein